jgi:LPS export ABC transporter protein LptC
MQGFKQILISALVLVLWVSCAKPKETVPVSEAVITQPYQEVDSSAMYFYNGKRLQWKLLADHLRKVLADTGKINADPVKLYVYDSLGKEVSKVLSDSGRTDNAMQTFSVWGNVFVRAQNGVRVRSNRLNWDLKTHLVTSADYVQLKTLAGDILQGKGLQAAEDFSWWKFEHDVSGVFPNFKERAEKGETF